MVVNIIIAILTEVLEESGTTTPCVYVVKCRTVGNCRA